MWSISNTREIEKKLIFGGAGLALLSGYGFGFTPKGFIAPPIIFGYAVIAYNTLKETAQDSHLETQQKIKKTVLIIFVSLASSFSLLYLCPVFYKKSFVLTSSLLLCLGLLFLFYWSKWNPEFNAALQEHFKEQKSPQSQEEIRLNIKKKNADLFFNFHHITSVILAACGISLIAFKILRPNY